MYIGFKPFNHSVIFRCKYVYMQHPEVTVVCYRYQAWTTDLDCESVWAFVQRHGGYLSIRNDCIDYFLPVQYQVLFALAFPELTRQYNLDLI